MSKPSLVIQPIDFDVATRAVERFSQERKIPSMVFPGEGEGAAKKDAEFWCSTDPSADATSSP